MELSYADFALLAATGVFVAGYGALTMAWTSRWRARSEEERRASLPEELIRSRRWVSRYLTGVGVLVAFWIFARGLGAGVVACAVIIVAVSFLQSRYETSVRRLGVSDSELAGVVARASVVSLGGVTAMLLAQWWAVRWAATPAPGSLALGGWALLWGTASASVGAGLALDAAAVFAAFAAVHLLASLWAHETLLFWTGYVFGMKPVEDGHPLLARVRECFRKAGLEAPDCHWVGWDRYGGHTAMDVPAGLFGRRPALLLTRSLGDFPAQEQDAVLLHEAAHEVLGHTRKRLLAGLAAIGVMAALAASLYALAALLFGPWFDPELFSSAVAVGFLALHTKAQRILAKRVKEEEFEADAFPVRAWGLPAESMVAALSRLTELSDQSRREKDPYAEDDANAGHATLDERIAALRRL